MSYNYNNNDWVYVLQKYNSQVTKSTFKSILRYVNIHTKSFLI